MRGLVLAAGAVALLSGCAAEQKAAPVAASAPAAVPPMASVSLGRGYLAPGMVPDSLLLDPPPPAAGSAAQARDDAGAAAAVALQGTERFTQAAIDADLFNPKSTNLYSCAAGMVIGADTTPKTYALLRKSASDFGLSTYPTKRKYMRARPFMVNGKPTCTPKDEAMLAKDGSYPSGHSAIGFGWGLVLAGLVPDHAAQLVARGRAFGDSRRICNVHWLSDTEEGRVMASAVYARLQADPAFRADLDAARQELAGAIVAPAATDCAREAAALAEGS